MHLSELKTLHISHLLDMATELEIENAQRMRKQELMFAILKNVPSPANRFSETEPWRFCPTDSVS